MPTHYNSGANLIIGAGGTVDLVPQNKQVTDATLTLIGVLTTFNITAPTNGTLTINNTVAAVSNLNITTEGSAVTLENNIVLGSSVGALGTVKTTINGGSLSIGESLITGDVLTSATVTFAAPGGTNFVGGGSFVTLDLLTAFKPYVGFNTPHADNIDDLSLDPTKFKQYTISQDGANQEIVVTDTDGTTFSFETKGTSFADNTYTSATTGPLLLTDVDGGTNITPNAVCFFRGTRIRTPEGESLVETLQTGDLVLTVDGRTLPIRWIGLNTVSTQFADPLRVMPVRIRAGALANNVPSQDLLVSPDHAMFIDGILIQAGALVNGVSIVRETEVPEIFTYYHIELEDHSLILAENAPTETFVDNIDRMAFDNWAEHQALFGDGNNIPEMDYPRAKSARQVPRNVRALLAARQLSIAEKIPVAA